MCWAHFEFLFWIEDFVHNLQSAEDRFIALITAVCFVMFLTGLSTKTSSSERKTTRSTLNCTSAS